MSEYLYPNWALWIAKDEDGQCWIYEDEPHQFHKGWYENEVGQYERVECPFQFKKIDWADSLILIDGLNNGRP